MNALKQWIDENNHTNATFGDLIGRSEATVSRIVRNQVNVGRDLALLIYEVTGHAITPNHLMNIGLNDDAEEKAA